MKQVTFSGGKGGTGKSTLAANYAAFLAHHHKKKVLLVDLDVQGNASFSFGVRGSTYNALDIYKGYVSAEDAIIHARENLDVIGSNVEFKQFANEDIDDLLGFVSEMDYDYVIYDIPPSVDKILNNVMAVVDKIYLTFVPEPYAVDGLLNLIEVVPKEKIGGVIINMYDHRLRVHRELVDQVKAFAEYPVFEPYIKRSILYVKPLLEQKTIIDCKSTPQRRALEDLFEVVSGWGV